MRKKKIIGGILCLFFLCSVVEYVEFILIRTDQTILAENVLCKLFAIVLIGGYFMLQGRLLAGLDFVKRIL